MAKTEYTEEKRQYQASNARSRFGKSTIDIECGFCNTVITAYVWSLAGGGKRCSNKNCKAIHYGWGYSIKKTKVNSEQTGN